MAMEAIKVLGQTAPTSGVLTDSYVVPSDASAAISSIVICNQTTSYADIRISIAVSGAADDPKQYIYYDLLCDPKNTFIATVGITLSQNDVVRVYSNINGVSFQFFGTEVTP